MSWGGPACQPVVLCEPGSLEAGKVLVDCLGWGWGSAGGVKTGMVRNLGGRPRLLKDFAAKAGIGSCRRRPHLAGKGTLDL